MVLIYKKNLKAIIYINIFNTDKKKKKKLKLGPKEDEQTVNNNQPERLHIEIIC